MIDTLHLPHQGKMLKPRTYRKKARKDHHYKNFDISMFLVVILKQIGMYDLNDFIDKIIRRFPFDFGVSCFPI